MQTPAFFRSGLLVFCLLISTLATAQLPAPAAQPVSPGYWNLETNLTTRNYTIVRFYNGQHQLVYEEQLDNLCLDLSKGNGRCRRTSRHLDAALQQVLREPQTSAYATVLARQFHSNRRVQRLYAVR